MNSDVYFTGRLDLCERYRNEVAQRKGIDPKDADDDEEFFPCGAACHARRGAIKLFGQFKNFKTDLDWKQGDGSRANETSILHNPIKNAQHVRKQDKITQIPKEAKASTGVEFLLLLRRKEFVSKVKRNP